MTRQLKLIDQCQELLTLPAQDALEKLPALQKRWKEIGITAYYKNKTNQKKFSASIDNIYQSQKKERKQHAANQKETLQKAHAIIDSIITLSKEYQSTTEPLNALQQQFLELAETLADTSLTRRYQSACNTFQTQQQQLEKKLHASQLVTARTLALIIDDIEAENPYDASSFEDPNISIPKAWMDKLRLRLDNTLSKQPLCDDKILEQCIEFEIACDTESPSHIKEQRMAYQVNKLSDFGIGSLSLKSKKETVEMEINLLSCGPVSATTRRDINQRIQTCLNKNN